MKDGTHFRIPILNYNITKLSKKTKSSVNPVNRPDDAVGMPAAFDVAAGEEGSPEPLAVTVVDGELLV